MNESTLKAYQFCDVNGLIFTVYATSYVEAARIARGNC